MTATIHADTRWTGTHGIGRYAHEVFSRLTLDIVPLALTGSPSSVTDAVRPRRVSRSTWCYSPGFNAQAGRPRQILTVHDLIHLDLPSPKRSLYRAYYAAVVRPAIRSAGTVFTVSQTSATRLADWLADDTVDIVVTGCGASSAFRPAPETNRDGFVCVTNLRPHKNLITLLDALRLDPAMTGNLVVPRSEAAATRELLRARGLDSRVHVHSGVSDEQLAGMYQSAAVSVFPSLLEGFGLPALESIRCGTPVVYWQGCASVAEIVGDAGIAVEQASDPGAWADALRAGSACGVHEQRDRFSWEVTASIVSRSLTQALS